jgi:hypothetical protein
VLRFARGGLMGAGIGVICSDWFQGECSFRSGLHNDGSWESE